MTAMSVPQATSPDGQKPSIGQTTDNLLLDGRVHLRQPLNGYRVAIDPVFLAAATPARDGQTVLDLGCGAGAAALCLLARVPGCHVTGWELQPELAELARENSARNDVRERFAATCRNGLERVSANHGRFDLVMTNPPYLADGQATPSPTAGKSLANQESEGSLQDWLCAALHYLRPGGHLSVIHRADRLHELLAALHLRAGDIAVFPLWPRQGQAARRVLLRARKDSGAPTRLLPGLELHGAGQHFTPEADAILRKAQSLCLD
ncbi:tRNA1(Val) (adenine(37)-N6)-methyltransferase [Fodinicurvata sediminis]|uniref:tRNA1(Val) (adenine(37)-N6)-methyltransferase n=1 Tax=Fodinicurvata sediminis TaxID=1121832 RepID=UPI00041864E8|nr:methyltransferase [Fodinicurvata sediminis]